MFSGSPPTFHVLVLMTDGANVEEDQMQSNKFSTQCPGCRLPSFSWAWETKALNIYKLEDVSDEERTHYRQFGTRHICDLFRIYEDYSTRRLVRPARFMREVSRHFHEYHVLTTQSILPDGIRNWDQSQFFSAASIREAWKQPAAAVLRYFFFLACMVISV